MVSWIKRMLTIVVGTVQTRIPQRLDWRGRPVGENRGEAIYPGSFRAENQSSTLYPRSAAPESNRSNAPEAQRRAG